MSGERGEAREGRREGLTATETAGGVAEGVNSDQHRPATQCTYK